MRILVLGAGAIGSVFGGFLAKAGHEVLLVGRKLHMEAIERNGLLIEGIWGTHTVRKNINVITNLSQLQQLGKAAFDICLLTVKSYDTSAVVSMLAQTIHDPPPVLSLQNGLGNIEKIEHLIGRKKTIGGRVIFGVEYKSPGLVMVTVAADKTYIGGLQDGISGEYVNRIAGLFTDAGIPTAPTENILQFIWGKALYNCSLNPLATILNVHYGMLLSNDATRQIIQKILEEIFALTSCLQLNLEWQTAEEYAHVLFNELIPRTFKHHPSMLQDINRGKKTEIDSLNGALAAMGRQAGIEMPYNWLLTQLIKAKEQVCEKISCNSN